MHVNITISQSYSVNNGDFMQDIDSTVSYVQQHGCAVITLEPEQRASLRCVYEEIRLPTGFGRSLCYTPS